MSGKASVSHGKLASSCRSGEGSRADQYSDLIASKKQKSDELTKGARVEELYSEAPVRAQAQNHPEDKKPFRHEEH